MPVSPGGALGQILDRITDQQVLALEQAAIRIPSSTFEEGPLADYLANYMADIGLDVEMMEVTHRAKPGKTTRQPIGRLRGTGGGPSLVLNGHMDPGVEMSGAGLSGDDPGQRPGGRLVPGPHGGAA